MAYKSIVSVWMLLLLFRCFFVVFVVVVILLSFFLFSIFGDGHVPTTRTAVGCIHLGTFSGSCGYDDDHSYYDNGNGIGTSRDYDKEKA
jgi:hypothetical protein